MRPSLRTSLAGAVLALVALGPLVATPAAAYPDAASVAAIDGACEGEVLRLHNQARANVGVGPLREDASVDQIARSWALQMARTRSLAHNPRYQSLVVAAVPSWQHVSENVGYARTASEMHSAYMGSAAHRSTLLSSRYSRVGIGCARSSDGRVWTALDFVGATSAIPDRRPAPFRSAGDASSRLRWWLLTQGPTATEVESDATNILTRGWGADELAVHLATSSTHSGRVPGVVRLYSAFFGRDPDVAGLRYWVERRRDDGELDAIATSFANAPEFRTLYGQLGNPAFVDLVYRNVLGRTPDAQGRAYWVDRLNRGTSRGKVMIGFSESPENRTATHADVTVSWAFSQLIGRRAFTSERTQWVGRFASGAPVADLVRYLVASDAFVARVAAGSY